MSDAPERRRRRVDDSAAAASTTGAAEAAVAPDASPDLMGVDAALGAPAAAFRPPVVEPPSADVVAASPAPRIPGAAREGYAQLPTAPVIVSAEGPVEGDRVEWGPPPEPRRAPVGPWALAVAVVALAASLFVGWMLPLGVAGIVTAIVTLRRRGESRAVAVWALVLSIVSVLYSAGWLLWALPQLPVS